MRSRVKGVVRALVVGTVGGSLSFAIGIPAPWLAGSLVATIFAIYSDQELDLPKILQIVAFILLGIQTGTAVNADTLARAVQWPLSKLCQGVTVVLIIWACVVYYERFRTWNRPTALFASFPGALSIVILLATSSAADMRRVIISQCARLFFLIAALPALIVFILPATVMETSTTTIANGHEIAILVGASAASGLLFAWPKVPAGLIMGAALMSAVLGLSGVVHGGTPDFILIPANIILGVMIGLRFKGISLPELRAALGDGLAGFVIAMIVALAGAMVISAVADLPLALTLLVFAPGGLEAMTIMAFALNLDPAYVAAHQIARYVGLVLLMPVVSAFVLHRGVTVVQNADVEKD